jgi:hypothetical protein
MEKRKTRQTILARGAAAISTSFLGVAALVMIRHVAANGIHNWQAGLKEILSVDSLLAGAVIASWILWFEVSFFLRQTAPRQFESFGRGIRQDIVDEQRATQQILNVVNTLRGNGGALATTPRAIPRFLREEWDELFDKISQISNHSRLHVEGTPDQIWARYQRFFVSMRREQEFCATCLIPQEIGAVFNDPNFDEYCRTSYERVIEGHCRSMRKLFIVEGTTLGESSAESKALLRKHFREASIAATASAGRISFKVVLWEELRGIAIDGNVFQSDFMLWGADLLVRGSMGTSKLLHGAELVADPDEVRRAQRGFNAYFERGKDLDQWSQQYLGSQYNQ